jgi:hypothetical protein
MLRELLVIFFLLNAIFWGLMPHSTHCRVVSQLFGRNMKCPPHIVHLSFGIISFLLAILFAQQEYVMNVLNDVKDIMVGAGHAVDFAKEKFQSAQHFRAEIEHFVDKQKSK